MNATVAKSETDYRLSRAELRRRWEQLDDDPLIAAIPCKVELNEKGVIEVSPPTTRHGFLQAYVTRELARQRPEMAEKTAAYLAAGAREVWLVDEDGIPEIHTSAGRVSVSTLEFELPRPPAAFR